VADKESDSQPLSEVEQARVRGTVIDETSQDVVLGPEQLVILAAVSIYSKAFLETLGRHAGDALAEMVRTRIRRKNGEITEAQIGAEGDGTATLVITDNMPDEARLALLDLDVTSKNVRGKVLRWDNESKAWRMDNTEE
jgi:hypothetical protein